ncbi:PspC domain-containing protein [Nonomuraea sp. KC401]|uniref:PspC domain-containing protein n=1 Tax=Nonomuraea longispora TaxID=1848320 RepID=A0A4V2XKQ6_9ACTN|nr:MULTISPECIES: PspC domain-containing protein [Nonomuraea]NBE95262.1 PspC domain-containing protein [Nonomuraea sp. K271]TDC07466.1 PspC domain-containing protein [Nonomuraea longispora]TLF51837.1 PspC domain-containing protein [Nonomuraea sp. KC401]
MNDYGNVKKLRRTHKGRIVAGVCAGVGEYVGIDANMVRIALAIATLFGGLGVGVYVIGWLLIPDEQAETSIVQDLVNKQQNRSTSTHTDWNSGDHKPQP